MSTIYTNTIRYIFYQKELNNYSSKSKSYNKGNNSWTERYGNKYINNTYNKHK